MKIRMMHLEALIDFDQERIGDEELHKERNSYETD